MDIYEEMVKAGVPVDHHESDLYAKKTPESEAIVDRYQFKGNVRTFTDEIDHEVWYDIPFAYKPFWDAIKGKAST